MLWMIYLTDWIYLIIFNFKLCSLDGEKDNFSRISFIILSKDN